MIYLAFRFEWKFAVAAIVANLHDVVIILGFFAFFQWEFSLAVLAAVLAVLGYSVNESVVIFDRIRENFRTLPQDDHAAGHRQRDHLHHQPHHHHPRLDADDGAVDAALRRPDAALLRLALTIGILFGIYSSVFVAAAIAMWLGVKREDLVKAGRARPATRTIRTPAPWYRVPDRLEPTAPPDRTGTVMATPSDRHALAAQARRFYVEALLARMPAAVHATVAGARQLIGQIADPVAQYKQRDTVPDLERAAPGWLSGMTRSLQAALASGNVAALSYGGGSLPGDGGMSLVDNDTIETEILSSRLALAMMDRASWQFTDLRSRMLLVEQRDELDPNDALRPHVLARIVTAAWQDARLARTPGGCCSRCCTTSSRCSSKRPTTS